MKKLYRFSSLLLISPVLGVITACHNDKPVIGYGYLESMELVNNASFEQPNPFDIEDPSGNALIPSDVEGQR
jgi:hypothetical protein